MITIFFKWLYSLVFHRKKIQLYKRVNEKLENRMVERYIVKGKILKELRRFLRVDAKSKYLPRYTKNNEEIYLHVREKFGAEIDRLGLKFTRELKIS